MNKKIIKFYSQDFDENKRHKDPFGVIQEYRTKEILDRYIPKTKMRILDIGGATGIYSFYLAEQNHDVTLFDISPNHIEIAKNKNELVNKKIKNIILGDACIDEINGLYDVIIVHGPLYHIIDENERISLLEKLKDNLSINGLIFGFAINHYAGLFYGIHSGEIMNKNYQKIVLDEIKTGIRKKDPGWYFHKSSELKNEFINAGYDIKAIKSVVTQMWMLPDIENTIKDKNKLKEIITLCNELEDELDIGQDLCIICKKEKSSEYEKNV